MPLLINVGLNRKASKDFQSVGVSLNLTAELDQALLTDSPRLQTEINRIYGQAEEALDRQVAAMSTDATPKVVAAPAQPHAHGNGHAVMQPPMTQRDAKFESGKFSGSVRLATESQLRALRSICKRSRFDLEHEAREVFGIELLDQLDVRQASQLIDTLKERQAATPDAGRRWR